MRLCIGQSALTGKLARYAQFFNLLELRADVGALPRPPRLREYAATAPEGFVFSVLSPRAAADLQPTAETEKALSYAEKAAAALGAEWFVLQTGFGVTPSARGRERLRTATERAAQLGLRVAWEPRGPWAPEQALEVCERLSIVLVRDLSLEDAPPGASVYTRIRAIGAGGRITSGAGDRIAERLADVEEAFVVVESASAKGLVRSLRRDLEAFPGEADEDEGGDEAGDEDADDQIDEDDDRDGDDDDGDDDDDEQGLGEEDE